MLMDTFISLQASGRDAEKLMEECEARLTQIDARFDAFDEGSEIYALNHANGEWTAVSGETFKLIQRAKQISELTGGTYDPTVFPAMLAWDQMSGKKIPSQQELTAILPLVDAGGIELDASNSSVRLQAGQMLDLGGIAKGYAADELSRLYKERGCYGVINLGGNVGMAGKKPDGGAWRIGVKDPFSDGLTAVITPEGGFAVTSGIYERNFVKDGVTYHHILDPKTLQPTRSGLCSVTVVGEDCTLCDALATAAVVLGEQDAATLLDKLGVKALMIRDDGSMVAVGGLKYEAQAG